MRKILEGNDTANSLFSQEEEEEEPDDQTIPKVREHPKQPYTSKKRETLLRVRSGGSLVAENSNTVDSMLHSSLFENIEQRN